MKRPFHFRAGLVVAITLCGLSSGAHASGTEPPVEPSASSVLGADVKGDNWTVAPQVESDGLYRSFAVETPYGAFNVVSQRRMAQRVGELRALQALEGMSRAKVFVNAVGTAGLAPLRFGRDMVVDPIATTGKVFSGMEMTVDNVWAGVTGKGSGRDSLLENAIGMTKAERDLAVSLQVDPYSDFRPLREGLADVARVMTAGNISVDAALSAIPGGAGIVVSGGSTASDLSKLVTGKSANELAALVKEKLGAQGIDPAITAKFLANHYYSPSDQFVIAQALETLNATNSEAFVSRASEAGNFDVAKFFRYRGELLVQYNAKLGTIKSFELVSGVLVNRNEAGNIVAAFAFDDVAWTDNVSQSLSGLSAAVATPGTSLMFATTGSVSAMAAQELKRLGWQVVSLQGTPD